MERRLTVRQLEVLRLLAKGRSTGEIAAELRINQTRVANDVYHARAKLAGLTRRPVRNRKEAVTVARAQGLID